ncbi:hypothetical protein HOD19_02950 [bacterium]|nr:hypothetical protein [bacterium]
MLHWRRALKVLPPPEELKKRENAIKIIAESFFKLLIKDGFQPKEIMQFINFLMDALIKHGHEETGSKNDDKESNTK